MQKKDFTHRDRTKMLALIKKIFFIISYFPLGSKLLKALYDYALKKLVAQYQADEDLVDLVLISHLPTFSFGRNQFTLLLITHDGIHPKGFLQEFRNKLSGHLLYQLVINLEYIPVLTQKEFRLDVLKGFLIRNSLRDTVKWRSLIKEQDYVFYVGKQNQFAINHTSFQNLAYFFFNSNSSAKLRTKVRNTKRSLENFEKTFSYTLDSNWKALTGQMIKFPILGRIYQGDFIKLTWSQLTQQKYRQPKDNALTLSEKFEVFEFCQAWLKKDFVFDIFLTPSLIQINEEEFRGKAYLDILLTRFPGKKKLRELEESILSHSSPDLRIRVHFSTPALFYLSVEESLYPFPLEPLLRKKIGISLKGMQYPFDIKYDSLILGCIHFLSSQFMRFRSLEQKSELIGSKFIKSLNLMYRYYLISRFLEGEEFELTSSPEEIREYLTPQFSEINIQDPVTEEDWIIIEAQLKYLLKKIRIQLTRYDDSLSQLRF